jgi:hypothetical protein
MIATLLIAAVVVAALGLGVRLYMSRSAEDRLRPGEDIAIAEFRGPLPGNGFLACPERYCAVAPDLTSPAFPVEVDRLHALWPQAFQGERGIVTLLEEPNRRRLVLVQHSALLGFPDVITVEFVPLEPNRSSVALYSRARYGKLDFGINRKRVERWISRLEQLAAAPPTPLIDRQ